MCVCVCAAGDAPQYAGNGFGDAGAAAVASAVEKNAILTTLAVYSARGMSCVGDVEVLPHSCSVLF